MFASARAGTERRDKINKILKANKSKNDQSNKDIAKETGSENDDR